MKNIELSICIVSWNCCETLQECLKSIFLHSSDLSFEVIVFDNASNDNSDEVKPKKNKTKKLIATDNVPSKTCVIFKKEEETQVVEIIKNMVKSEFKLLKMK